MWVQVQGPCFREAAVWASRTLHIGGGMGGGQGGSETLGLSASCICGSRLRSWQGGRLSALPACVEGLWDCLAQQEWQWWEGRLPSLSTPDLTRPHQGSRVPKQPLPCLALKTWKMWTLKGMRDITKNSKRRACILSQILPVLMHQTKTLVLPSCITD